MMSDDIYSNYDVIVSPKSEENKDKLPGLEEGEEMKERSRDCIKFPNRAEARDFLPSSLIVAKARIRFRLPSLPLPLFNLGQISRPRGRESLGKQRFPLHVSSLQEFLLLLVIKILYDAS